MRLLIKGGEVLSPANKVQGICDILCEDGKIAAMAPDLPVQAEQVIDATGCLVFPALTDIHAHTGEPGHEPRESLASFAEAAVRGGFGTALLMPDTDPPRESLADVRSLLEASSELPIKVLAAGALTKGLAGEEPTEWGELATGGVVAVGDCKPLVDTSLLRRALLYLRMWDLPILVDAVDPYLAKNATAREGYHATIFGLRGMPAEAEEWMIARDLVLARLTGGRLHFQRVSTKQGVEQIAEAKAEGIPVTAEVSWLHLLKNDSALESYDTSFKVWPPLGSEEDRQALIEGVKSGVIDAIVTDHTPFATEEKEVEFDLAPFGAAGAEHALPALWGELVRPGILLAETLIERFTAGPAKILGVEPEALVEGGVANLVVLDPSQEWVPTTETQASWAANHPYLGATLTARIQATILNGQVAYEAGEE